MTAETKESAGRDYTAWLVEINEQCGPVYFQFVHDDDWTKDHDRAVHFSRREDAERMIEHYGWTQAKAIEHCWPATATGHCPIKSSGE